MRRCTKCKREKDESAFCKLGSGLQYWCKKCHLEKIRAYRKKEKEERLAEEKIEKIKQAIFRREALEQPSFIYQNGYTLNVIPIHDHYKIEICDGQEEMAILLPAGRAELLKDWLCEKLKGEKE